jgi:hypothetical protein
MCLMLAYLQEELLEGRSKQLESVSSVTLVVWRWCAALLIRAWTLMMLLRSRYGWCLLMMLPEESFISIIY